MTKNPVKNGEVLVHIDIYQQNFNKIRILRVVHRRPVNLIDWPKVKIKCSKMERTTGWWGVLLDTHDYAKPFCSFVTFDWLDWVDDYGDRPFWERFEGLLSVDVHSGEPTTEAGVRVVPSHDHLGPASLWRIIKRNYISTTAYFGGFPFTDTAHYVHFWGRFLGYFKQIFDKRGGSRFWMRKVTIYIHGILIYKMFGMFGKLMKNTN